MNTPMYRASATTAVPTLTVNRVLRNTYALLAMLFVFGGITAYAAQAAHIRLGFLPFIIGIFAFSFAIGATRNSAWGLVVAFGFAGFLGVFTGGNVDAILYQYRNGGELVAASFGLTAGIFLALSAYAMTTKRDFSGWFAFLGVGTLAILGAIILNFFLQIPALSLALSTMVILLACGWIIWQTQMIVRGGETNYILAATGLLADIFVLFNNLLALLGFGFGED
ncbi:Bax inhibitor-1 family protein [Elongatibacter sediminis]|uniref:Bax inhibitor-1 family protein n=1 Tax=Elongatibacter sediminis TaxID=3119006 RepID=A0AAW9RJL2_9GAMM